MNLPTVDSLEIEGKRVIVRADLDVGINQSKVENSKRLEVLLPTIQKLLEKNPSQVEIIGHRGRPARNASSIADAGGPEGEVKEEFSLRPLGGWFAEKLSQEVGFVENFDNERPGNKVLLMENLRFWKGEEENSEEFVNQLNSLGDVYVNEAFGSSHREHASIVGLPKRMPHAAGEHFAKEVEQLTKLTEDPSRPLVSFLNGVKEDKLSYLDKFIELSDFVFVGGRLPLYMDEDYKHDKVFVSHLIQDKEDITLHSVEKMEQEAAKAKTILLSGPVGKFEEEGHRLGTKRVFEAIANSEAYKIAGGGDTEAAISLFGLTDKFDWISTGGGAMLDFIANGTLPGIEALK